MSLGEFIVSTKNTKSRVKAQTISFMPLSFESCKHQGSNFLLENIDKFFRAARFSLFSAIYLTHENLKNELIFHNKEEFDFL